MRVKGSGENEGQSGRKLSSKGKGKKGHKTNGSEAFR